MLNKKAFVCFCVDGPSDISALQCQFSDLFDKIGGDDINVDFRYADFQGENKGDIRGFWHDGGYYASPLMYICN